jgi:U3 small nucleolar RNA-associated protein 18
MKIFMVDSVGSTALVPAQSDTFMSDEDDPHGISNAPAWHDSDDERLLVSLASNSRLRTLRRTEEEDVINGREYARRLRQQFLKLHPTPDWVKEASLVNHNAKRRKIALGDESMSEDESDDDSSEASAQPLARLLRSSTGLIQTSLTKVKKRKWRPEVINIQRTKHICNEGPVSRYILTENETLD